MKSLKTGLVFLPFALATLLLIPMTRAEANDPVQEARQTTDEMTQVDPGLDPFFRQAAGYVVFPTVGKGGFIVGGAHGNGTVFERGQPVGKASITQLSIGAQAGGQAYSEIIFFETPQALASFKNSDFTLSAQVSAVALTSGASANARYNHGVAVFTYAKGGLMAEAAVGGQKFHYEPFAR